MTHSITSSSSRYFAAPNPTFPSNSSERKACETKGFSRSYTGIETKSGSPAHRGDTPDTPIREPAGHEVSYALIDDGDGGLDHHAFDRKAEILPPHLSAPASRRDRLEIVIHPMPTRSQSAEATPALAQREVEQLHPPVNAAVPAFERLTNHNRLQTAQRYASAASFLGLVAFGYVSPRMALLISAATVVGWTVGISVATRAGQAISLDRAQAREARQPRTPTEQLVRVVEIANEDTLTSEGLARCVKNILEVGRRHPGQISGHDMADALVALSRQGLYVEGNGAGSGDYLAQGLTCLLDALEILRSQGLITDDDFITCVIELARRTGLRMRKTPPDEPEKASKAFLRSISSARGPELTSPLKTQARIQAMLALWPDDDPRHHIRLGLGMDSLRRRAPKVQTDALLKLLAGMRPAPPEGVIEVVLDAVYDLGYGHYLAFARQMLLTSARPLVQTCLPKILRKLDGPSERIRFLTDTVGDPALAARLERLDVSAQEGEDPESARIRIGVNSKELLASLGVCTPLARLLGIKVWCAKLQQPMAIAQFVLDCMEAGWAWPKEVREQGLLPKAWLEDLIERLGDPRLNVHGAIRPELMAGLMRAGQLGVDEKLMRLAADTLRRLPELQPPQRDEGSRQPRAFGLSATGLRCQKVLLEACTGPGVLLVTDDEPPAAAQGLPSTPPAFAADAARLLGPPLARVDDLVHPSWLGEALWQELTQLPPGLAPSAASAEDQAGANGTARVESKGAGNHRG